MTAACPVCGRMTSDPLLCSRSARNRQDEGCTEHLERQLADVPTILEQLDITMSRQDRIPAGSPTPTQRPKTAEYEWAASHLAHERMAIHLGAIQAADNLAHALTHWAKNVLGWDTPAHVPDPTAAAARALLRPDAIARIRRRPDVLEIVEGIYDAIYDARRATDQPAQRTIPVGPCPEITDEGPCPGEVVAILPTDNDRPSHAECRHNPDGHQWSSIQFTRLGDRIQSTIQTRGKAGAA